MRDTCFLSTFQYQLPEFSRPSCEVGLMVTPVLQMRNSRGYMTCPGLVLVRWVMVGDDGGIHCDHCDEDSSSNDGDR